MVCHLSYRKYSEIHSFIFRPPFDVDPQALCADARPSHSRASLTAGGTAAAVATLLFDSGFHTNCIKRRMQPRGHPDTAGGLTLKLAKDIDLRLFKSITDSTRTSSRRTSRRSDSLLRPRAVACAQSTGSANASAWFHIQSTVRFEGGFHADNIPTGNLSNF